MNVIAGVFLRLLAKYGLKRSLEKLPTLRLQHGIAHLPEHPALRPALGLAEPLGGAERARERARRGFLSRWLGGQAGVRAEIAELLEFSGLAHKQDELAANLAFGEQRRLELARALAASRSC